MITHETALIHIAVDTLNTSFTGILPHGNIAIISNHGFLVGIHGNHDFIVVHLAQQVLVVEVAPRI